MLEWSQCYRRRSAKTHNRAEGRPNPKWRDLGIMCFRLIVRPPNDMDNRRIILSAATLTRQRNPIRHHLHQPPILLSRLRDISSMPSPFRSIVISSSSISVINYNCRMSSFSPTRTFSKFGASSEKSDNIRTTLLLFMLGRHGQIRTASIIFNLWSGRQSPYESASCPRLLTCRPSSYFGRTHPAV